LHDECADDNDEEEGVLEDALEDVQLVVDL